MIYDSFYFYFFSFRLFFLLLNLSLARDAGRYLDRFQALTIHFRSTKYPRTNLLLVFGVLYASSIMRRV